MFYYCHVKKHVLKQLLMQHYHHEARNFEDARDICQGQASDLVIINSLTENKYIYDIANRDQVDVWLGIRENVSTFLDLMKHLSQLNFLIPLQAKGVGR